MNNPYIICHFPDKYWSQNNSDITRRQENQKNLNFPKKEEKRERRTLAKTEKSCGYEAQLQNILLKLVSKPSKTILGITISPMPRLTKSEQDQIIQAGFQREREREKNSPTAHRTKKRTLKEIFPYVGSKP